MPIIDPTNPLRSPAELSPTAIDLLRRGGVRPGRPDVELLRQVARVFAGLPYENLSKIIKTDAHGRGQQARRGPDEVLADHLREGTGGTCFSLTAAFLHILRALGWDAEPILADRHYGQDTHCALLVWIDGRPHLLDPGYLILDPIPLDDLASEQRVASRFNELRLVPHGDGRVDLHTVHQGRDVRRLTFKTDPADPAQFLRAWDSSFGWDMMRYPVLTRVVGDRQLYLQGRRFQVRGREDVERRELTPDEHVRQIAEAFGIRPAVAARALEILRRHGEDHG